LEKTIVIGRRKEATARVMMAPAANKSRIVINGKDYTEYFPQKIYQVIVEQPIHVAGVADRFDFSVNVSGGGVKGQAEAVRLAIARSLVNDNAESKPVLKAQKLLTRDPRAVERKKPGRKKARKRFQFSKR
jgi:small subunit ribosomal protein S9